MSIIIRYAEILVSILGVTGVASTNTRRRADAPILEAISWIHAGIACYAWETTQEKSGLIFYCVHFPGWNQE